MVVAHSHVIHTLALIDCSTLYGCMSELCRVCHFYYVCMFQRTVHVRVVCQSSVWLAAVHFLLQRSVMSLIYIAPLFLLTEDYW